MDVEWKCKHDTFLEMSTQYTHQIIHLKVYIDRTITKSSQNICVHVWSRQSGPVRLLSSDKNNRHTFYKRIIFHISIRVWSIDGGTVRLSLSVENTFHILFLGLAYR